MGLKREPARVSPGGALSARMSTLARRNTKPELRLRRALHSRGLRFRVQLKVPGNARRSIDVAFTRARLAVYVDGCFWHGCPQHYVRPRTNADWWLWKIEMNQRRDYDTNAALAAAGWQVLRVWEHLDPEDAANLVERTYLARLSEVSSAGSGPADHRWSRAGRHQRCASESRRHA